MGTERCRAGWRLLQLAVAFLGCVVATGAQISPVAGAPFTATRVHTSPDGVTVQAKIARASNGSVYEEIPDVRPGHLPLASILDIANHRRVFLRGDTKTYTVQPDHTVPRTLDVSDAAVQERVERFRGLPPRHDVDGEQEADVVPIGLRVVEGQTEYGMRRTFVKLAATSKLRERVWEMWDRPSLMLTVETVGIDDAGRPASITKLTNIQAVEPDARLFEIPADYTPSTPQRH